MSRRRLRPPQALGAWLVVGQQGRAAVTPASA